jgi:hypothetical protein
MVFRSWQMTGFRVDSQENSQGDWKCKPLLTLPQKPRFTNRRRNTACLLLGSRRMSEKSYHKSGRARWLFTSAALSIRKFLLFLHLVVHYMFVFRGGSRAFIFLAWGRRRPVRPSSALVPCNVSTGGTYMIGSDLSLLRLSVWRDVDGDIERALPSFRFSQQKRATGGFRVCRSARSVGRSFPNRS